MSDLFDSTDQPMILGFDPGHQKCGIAVMSLDRKVQYHQVVVAQAAISTIQGLQQKFPISLLVIGDQTSAQAWKQKLSQQLSQPLRIMTVDERYSSLEARKRYWQMYPPKGPLRLIPQEMRTIHRPIDDVVAIILIERYLERLVN